MALTSVGCAASLGGEVGPDASCEDELAAGDIVGVELDFEVFKAMHKEEHLWVKVLSKVVVEDIL